MADFENTERLTRLEVRYFSEVGPRRRENQDNFYVLGVSNLLSQASSAGETAQTTQTVQAVAVFDGMGGEAEGEKASLAAAVCMDRLISALEGTLSEERLAEAWKVYYARFMNALRDYLEDDCTVSGTTFAGVFMQGELLIPAWLGDSRVYLLRGGRLYRLTKDHTQAQQKIDRGEITEEEAKTTRQWHTLTFYMGQADTQCFVGQPLELLPGDRLFLCSDGITDLYSDEALTRLLEGNSKIVMADLAAAARERSEDNCTGVLIDVVRDPLRDALEKIKRGIKLWQQPSKSKEEP